MKHRLRYTAEYAALRLFTALVNALPDAAAAGLAVAAAWLGHRVFRYRAATARSRIRAVFGDGLPAREQKRIAWLSFRNLCLNAVESLRMRHLTREWLDRQVRIEGRENLTAVLREGRGAILVVPHMGNWELGGAALRLLDVPVFLVAARQSNPLTNDFLNRLRGATGADILQRDAPGALRGIVRRLRQGNALASALDLRSSRPGVRVRFLGQEANLAGGLARFSHLTGAPFVPALDVRVGRSRHIWRFFPPIRPDPAQPPEEDARRMTQQTLDLFEPAIRAEPEQYFWYNKRWVLDPLPAEPDQNA